MGPSSIVRLLKSKTPITEMIPSFHLKMKKITREVKAYNACHMQTLVFKPFPRIPSFQTWEAYFKLLQTTNWPSIQNILEMMFVKVVLKILC